MTDDELQEIEERADRAALGPWQRQIGNDWREVWDKYGNLICTTGSNNGDFIAHARDDIPALLAEIRRLKANL